MYIWLSGPIGRLVLLAIAVLGFLAAMGDALDMYDALWKFTVPLTLVYAVVIWRFVLTPGEDEAKPEGPLAAYLIVKLAMTIALLLATLGVISLGYYACQLVAGNWPWIVLTFVFLAVVVAWSMTSEAMRRRKAESERRATASVRGRTKGRKAGRLVS